MSANVVYDSVAREGSQELACAARADALQPISRFVEGLAAHHVRRVAFSVIGGMPEDLSPAPGDAPDYERLAARELERRDPRMVPRAHDADPSRLAAACESAERGRGAPAVRLLQVARELDELGVAVGAVSICADDYRPALQPLVERVASGWARASTSRRGARCDLRPRGELDPARFPGDPTPHGFCMPATCR